MSKLHRSFQVLFFSVVLLFPLQGCGMFESDLITEMDSAYKGYGKAKSTQQEKERDEKVLEVVKKHFPVGMLLSDALTTMKGSSLIIYEYNQTGHKKWPDGTQKQYEDESHKKSAEMDKFMISYLGEKQIGAIPCFFRRCKYLNVVINSDGKYVVDVRGVIYIDSFL